MNRLVLALIVAAAALAASAQSPVKPSTSATPAPKTSSPASTASAKKPSTTASAPATPPAPWIKLPKGVPAVAHLPVKTIPLSVHYEDIKIGTGAEGESGKVWHIKYTGWRAADGVMFDSWDQHGQPVIGSDGRPVLDADGKIKLKDPEPQPILQGVGRVIPGFDFGLAGMKIGGRRRIFIPWQLAYGTRSHARPAGPSRHSRQVRPYLRRGTGGRNRHADSAAHGRKAHSASRREHGAQRAARAIRKARVTRDSRATANTRTGTGAGTAVNTRTDDGANPAATGGVNIWSLRPRRQATSGRPAVR